MNRPSGEPGTSGARPLETTPGGPAAAAPDRAAETTGRLGDLYRAAAQRLREAAPPDAAGSDGPAAATATPELDARLLLAEAAGIAPAEVHRASGRPVGGEVAGRLETFLSRRIAGEPVHRIIGRRAFYDHEFALSPETLEPRPETEILVEVAQPILAAAAEARGEALFADIGTGTGAIAVSLLALCRQARAVASDIAEGALRTARANAEAAGVGDRFLPVLADNLSAFGGRFDAILANPPYIPSGEIEGLDVSVRRFDPRLALDGGPDGLAAYRAIAAEAGRVLRPGGATVVEIGRGQAADVEAIFAGSGFRPSRRFCDLSGIERVLVLTLCEA
ncbi:peptide chain release factor N(5)-glutamine methyltransferase [Jiella sonneratiae]|uniref:Release factor glutamine methyltransferase n=1 Tax=Jiella sonneratiae TaxID=2816856 RepID=A0ABS3J9X0_9HYPH|nr:peptide chain release factor N(5)-glutamine methyltransferase [Jiella sonneratiae]MBO0906478.1 peptide chain release factor N(5)-glutamine methyltransferase [Jiella sonneratiae]